MLWNKKKIMLKDYKQQERENEQESRRRVWIMGQIHSPRSTYNDIIFKASQLKSTIAAMCMEG